MKPLVVLTGGSGFIGEAIAAAIAEDFELWTISRSRPCPHVEKTRNIPGDLASANGLPSLGEILPARPIHAVVHAAASTPRLGNQTLEQLFQANVFGTERLLTALPSPPARIAYLSTVDIYGKNSSCSEDSPAAPSGAYALSKYTGEQVAYYWSQRHDSSVGVFRLGQTYGPGDPTAKAVPSFCRAVASGKAPSVSGAGAELRQPIFVSDVADAIRSWLLLDEVDAMRNFILSGGEKVSIAALAALVMQIGGLAGTPRHEPEAKAPEDSCFDNSRTCKELHWMPRVPLQRGLELVLNTLRTTSK